jgi:hypothetical protein
MASGRYPRVRERHGRCPKLGSAPDIVWLRPIDVGVEPNQTRHQVLISDLIIMMDRCQGRLAACMMS